MVVYGLLFLIFCSPLPAASVHEWSILVIQMAVLFLLGVYFWEGREDGVLAGVGAFALKAKHLFLAFFIFIFIQVIQTFNVSFLPHATITEGLELLTYFLVGFLVVKKVRHRSQIRLFFYVIIASGLFQAFYGLFELYNKSPHILFYKKIYGLDSVTGTFVNRNHLSGYLEMIIPLAIGLVVSKIDIFSIGKMKWRQKFLYISEKGMAKNLLLSFGILVMALAVIFSKSRSGVFILIMMFLLFFEMTVLFFRRERRRRKWTKNFLAVTFIGLTFLSFYLGIDSVLSRFSRLQDQSRMDVWSNTLQIIADYPVFGTGLGTFQWMLPQYEKHWQKAHFTYAHNDYLEYLSELGIVGFSLLFGGILYMLIKSFLIWKERRHPEVKGLALGGMIAIINMLIHSITDFNLHIPANMLTFGVILSLTWVTVNYKYEPGGRKQQRPTREKPKAISSHRFD